MSTAKRELLREWERNAPDDEARSNGEELLSQMWRLGVEAGAAAMFDMVFGLIGKRDEAISEAVEKAEWREGIA